MTVAEERPSGRRVALVTGADSGIGRATAVRLAQEGYDVGITWHRDRQGAERTAEEVREQGGRAVVRHVLVNCTGTGASVPYLDTPPATLREVLEVDLVAPYLCAQPATRRMVRQGRGGRIANITRVHEHQPRVGSSAYCAAKGGLGLLGRVTALEPAEHGITVNAAAPGEIATPMPGRTGTDVHATERPGIPRRASRWAAPGTPGRSRRWSPSRPARTPGT